MHKFKQRWGIDSNLKLVLIIIVFALTGTTSAWFSKPIIEWIGVTESDFGFWLLPIRFFIIFLSYQILLLVNGFLFGQFNFFWTFEIKIIKGLGFGFLFPKSK